MISHISWTQFVFTLGFFALAYYLYLFYRFARKAERKDYPEQEDLFDPPYDQDQEKITDELFDKAELLIDKLTERISQATDKDTLLPQLHSELLAYPELNIAAFRAGINNRIITEVEKYCPFTLSESEIDGLW